MAEQGSDGEGPGDTGVVKMTDSASWHGSAHAQEDSHSDGIHSDGIHSDAAQDDQSGKKSAKKKKSKTKDKKTAMQKIRGVFSRKSRKQHETTPQREPKTTPQRKPETTPQREPETTSEPERETTSEREHETTSEEVHSTSEEVRSKPTGRQESKETSKNKAKGKKTQRSCCNCCFKRPLLCRRDEFPTVTMGGRKSKTWYLCTFVRDRSKGFEPDQVVHFEAASIETARDLVTVQEVLMKINLSVNCTFEFTDENLMTLNGLLSQIHTFPGVVPVAVGNFLENGEKKVGIYQPYYPHGSLKDRIYTSKGEVPEPKQDWDMKYSEQVPSSSSSSVVFGVEKIALYGRQILETLQYFNGLGFPPLGHVQSGNVFVHTDGDGNEVCKLGGYENTLLGYNTRLYKLYKGHLQHIDVLMFGHLVFEMAAGYELTTTEPTDDDYAALNIISEETDGETDLIAKVLANIFNPVKPVPKHMKFFQKLHLKSPDRIPSVDEILEMEPFCSVSTGWKVHLSDKEQALLDLVMSGVPFIDSAGQGQTEGAAAAASATGTTSPAAAATGTTSPAASATGTTSAEVHSE